MRMVNYRHFRQKDNSTGELSQYGGVTIAAIFFQDKVKIGFALCSDKEKYSREIGKDIAVERLDKFPVVIELESFVNYIREVNVAQNFALTKETLEEIYAKLTFKNFNKESIYQYFLLIVMPTLFSSKYEVGEKVHIEKRNKVQKSKPLFEYVRSPEDEALATQRKAKRKI